MAWLTHNGTQWYVGYRQGRSRKPRYVAAGPNKRKAMELRDAIAHRARLARAGGTVVPEAITFGEYLEGWLNTRTVAPTTRQREGWVKQETRDGVTREKKGGIIFQYLVPELGDRLLGELKPDDFAQLTAKLTSQTARRALAVASKALADAVANERIPRNPVRLPAPPRRIHDEISLDALCAVVAAMPARWRPFTFALLLTGCRFGELTALTWADVDLEAGKVYVRRQKPSHLYREAGRAPAPLKTIASHRAIDMLPPLQRMLLDLPQHGEGGIVFPGAYGGYINYHYFHKAWRAAVETLKLRVNPHTLRHAFGSLLLAFGEPLPYVTAQLGHTSAAFTLSTYLHQVKEGRRLDREATMAKLEKAFRGEMVHAGLTPLEARTREAVGNAT